LEAAIQSTWDIFSENAFRKWNGSGFERRFNRAVFDVMVYYFRNEKVRHAAMLNSDVVVTEFKRLCDESLAFKTSIETTTKSIGALSKRLELWGDRLAKVLTVPIPIPMLDSETGRITAQR
jgi:hypothetical protein